MEESVKIYLNEEQTRRFLSCFIPEAFSIAKARMAEKEAAEKLAEKEVVQSGEGDS